MEQELRPIVVSRLQGQKSDLTFENIKTDDTGRLLVYDPKVFGSLVSFEGTVTGIVGAPKFQCSGLTGFGNDYFEGYWAYVVWDADGAGAAPQGEQLVCTGYVSVSGDFTVAAFSAAIVVGDKVLLIHPSIAYMGNKVAGRTQSFTKNITSAANAAPVTVATVTTQACKIKSVVVRANAAQTAALTSIAITCGAGDVVTLIDAVLGLRANIAATDQQVSWEGTVTLPTGGTIVITFVGSGATAVNLQVDTEYEAITNGGYLA